MIQAHDHISHIMSNLFAAEHRRLQRSVERLHTQNEELQGEKLQGFLYRGKWFQSEKSTVIGRRNTIHIDLWPDADHHLAEIKKLELDKGLIQQALFRQIMNAITLQDVRDQVPECLADCHRQEVKILERRGNPDGWKTQSQLQQFNEALPLMEFYSSTRLIY